MGSGRKLPHSGELVYCSVKWTIKKHGLTGTPVFIYRDHLLFMEYIFVHSDLDNGSF